MFRYLKVHGIGLLYGVLLTGFTVYLFMDTFFISKVYRVAEETEEQDIVLENNQEEASYEDGNISITLTEYREEDTSIYVADIVLSFPEYLKTAFAQNSYGKNVTEKTSEIAEGVNAMLAINGDYYGAQELLSFGPALIENGTIAVTEEDEVGKAMASNPRTAIGIIDNLHYVFVVSDGRTEESEGLSLLELAEFMDGLGVETAYNLDGGGSSTMYFNGEVINTPTTDGRSVKERSVSDIVYIGY